MANILGINLNELKEAEVWKKIADFLNSPKQHYLVTPNPEIILEAHQDEEFFYILNQADLALADGFGLKIAGLLFGYNLPRLTGADLTPKLLSEATEKKLKILVLNWEKGLSAKEEINRALEEKYPTLNFLVINVGREKFLTPETIATIKEFSPQILFSALGFPYQEKVIYHNLDKLPSIKLALGIGGSFDFITGKIKRAPKFLRTLGLEWFWRLSHQPRQFKRRLGRIYNATFKFLVTLIRSRFICPWFYRANVACLLYKKEAGQKKILILEREDEAGHWQLPQGGLDGEAPEIAGARELREEIGTDKFRVRGVFKNLYRYQFGQTNNKTGKTEKRNKPAWGHQLNYKGQKQSLLVAEFLGEDKDIKICFWDHTAWKWVEAAALIKEVHPVRQRSAAIFLEKFNLLNL